LPSEKNVIDERFATTPIENPSETQYLKTQKQQHRFDATVVKQIP
jgi:hypothetical protein